MENKCEVIENVANNNKFFYCRAHKLECKEDGCEKLIPLTYANVIDSLRVGVSQDSSLSWSIKYTNHPIYGKLQHWPFHLDPLERCYLDDGDQTAIFVDWHRKYEYAKILHYNIEYVVHVSKIKKLVK